jgi:hypothetical protein
MGSGGPSGNSFLSDSSSLANHGDYLSYFFFYFNYFFILTLRATSWGAILPQALVERRLGTLKLAEPFEWAFCIVCV